MPRQISFALTTPQFIAGTKTVTRRMGWLFLKAGDILMAVEKSQGIPKGGKVKTLGLIRVVSAERVVLKDIDAGECRLEGFPDMLPADFIKFFCDSHVGCAPLSVITRIEFEKC